MTQTLTVTKNKISLGLKSLTVLRLNSGRILVPYTEAAQLLNIDSKTLKALIKNNRVYIDVKLKAVPVEFVDNLVFKLAKEKLSALNILKILQGKKIAKIAAKVFDDAPVVQSNWLEYRLANRDIHAVFQNHCVSNTLPGGHVHNAMTMLVFGQTAEEARTENAFVGLDPDCGLDHQDNAEGMRMIARMKLKFCTYRSGTWQQRVVRSYEDCVIC